MTQGGMHGIVLRVSSDKTHCLLYLESGVHTCGENWQKRRYPVTNALIPVDVMVWGEAEEFWLVRITEMKYFTYVVQDMLTTTLL